MAIPQLEIDSNAFSTTSQTAIVMFSGGFDSTVALWWAMQRYKAVKAITVNYNQPWQQELHCAESIIALTDIMHSIVSVDIPEYFWGIQHHYARWQPCLMCSIAAMDINDDGADIILGALKTDRFPESKPEFLQALSDAVFENAVGGVKIGIVTPLLAVKNKTAVAVLGYQLGAPMHLSWTCRYPINGHPCYECGTCIDRYRVGDEIQSVYGISEDDLEAWAAVLGSPYHASFENASPDILAFAEAYLDVIGIKNGTKGWRYHAPDGTERITSAIKNPTQQAIATAQSTVESSHIRVHGFFEDEAMWEVYICADGSVAATDRLPSLEIIKNKFSKNIGE
ncbi:MAG: 7-cyano-7-deazaguanine synthase [Treponema sp.]|jgi:7-cyano-7-deazaguanine synthase|nr:7-cyano-7-deazaguanine synthase [Treponema sp.]